MWNLRPLCQSTGRYIENLYSKYIKYLSSDVFSNNTERNYSVYTVQYLSVIWYYILCFYNVWPWRRKRSNTKVNASQGFLIMRSRRIVATFLEKVTSSHAKLSISMILSHYPISHCCLIILHELDCTKQPRTALTGYNRTLIARNEKESSQKSAPFKTLLYRYLCCSLSQLKGRHASLSHTFKRSLRPFS